VSSLRWGRAEPSVGAAGQLPAVLVHGPMVGPAEEGQVVQVGRAALHPMVEMVGVAPGQRPITARKDTAPVTHGQGGPLSRLDDPGGPTHLQGLAGGAAQGRGQRGGRRPQPRRDVGRTRRLGHRPLVPGHRSSPITGVAGVAGDQDPGHRPVTGQPPTRLGSQWPCPPHVPTETARTS
jgi:hypothetical protein